MTVFIELTTSPLYGFGALGDGTGRRAGKSVVRRPLRGIEIKDDTYATLRVVRSDGTPVDLLDSSSKTGKSGDGYANFILQSVQEQRVEKTQIIETFGASYVFFFGEQPRILQVSSLLLNTHDFNWEAEWWANYNTYFRGTKLVEMQARCYLAYDDTVLEGYLMMAAVSKEAATPYHVPMQFQFFVTNCTNTSNVGSPNFPTRLGIDRVALDAGREKRALQSAMQKGFLGTNAPQERELRGFISDNTDEYTGPMDAIVYKEGESIGMLPKDMFDKPLSLPGNVFNGFDVPTQALGGFVKSPIDMDTPLRESTLLGSGANSSGKNGVSDIATVSDPITAAQQQLAPLGVSFKAPEELRRTGMFPNFTPRNRSGGATFSPISPTGLSFGASARASASVSVGPGGVSANARAGASAYANVGGKTHRAGASASASAGVDALGAVYSRSASRSYAYSRDARARTETGTDYSYGYRSSYATRPGFGRAGYGDQGGNGYGSACAAGDPGFVWADGVQVTWSPSEGLDVARAFAPKTDRTALTDGSVAGRGEFCGGASVLVGGKLSAFSLTSVDGDLGAPVTVTTQVNDDPPVQHTWRL